MTSTLTPCPARPTSTVSTTSAVSTTSTASTTSAVSTPSAPAVHALRARFAGFGAPFWVVISGTAVNRIGNMVLPFLVFYLGSRHIATDRIPFVLGALGAGGLCGPVLGGLLTDRFGSRVAMVSGMLATAASQGLLFVAPNLATLVLATLALGAGGTLHMPGAGAVVASAAQGERRRVAFGLFHWSINVGTAVAGAIGGFLAEHGYGLLFALDAATCLAYALLVATRLPRGTKRSGQQARGGYGVVLRDRLLLALLAPVVMGEAIYGLTEFSLPLAIRDHGLPPTVFGLAAVVNAALVVALQPIASVWLTRFDRGRLWAVACTLIALGVALTGVASNAWEFALTVVVWSLGEVAGSGLYASMVADLAPEDAVGRYQGAAGWGRGLARFGSLLLGSAAYAVLGAAVLWWTALAVGLAGAGLALLVGAKVRARTS
ncbi:MFS transporter [Kitasatospora acidiphila]|uniref:MFS transporter n=1 Tax=Kitasatospora acidiphila TaxID=2567942 RepID=UPI003C771538